MSDFRRTYAALATWNVPPNARLADGFGKIKAYRIIAIKGRFGRGALITLFSIPANFVSFYFS